MENMMLRHAPTLNKGEHLTILSLIAFVAYSHNKDKSLIEAVTLEKFKADTVNSIDPRYFDEAVRYLVDLNPHEHIN